ncbi:MAG: hypothetical protein JNL28_10125 [Planctomycetes bacterium]|nr:hypothetical protein [Planctomycetota bacterium]
MLFQASADTVRVVARRGAVDVFARAAAESKRAWIRIILPPASGADPIRCDHELPGLNHYFLGNDPANWTRGVRRFDKVTYPCIVDGVDLVLHATRGRIEYDLVVQPGADLASLRFECQGSQGLTLDNDGSLVMHTQTGELIQTPPVSAFEHAGRDSAAADVRFLLLSDSSFGFALGEESPSAAVRIDPSLIWSTYLGSSGAATSYAEYGAKCAVDQAGALTVMGQFNGSDFPTTPGSVQIPTNSGFGVFVSKFDSTGSLVYSSLIGATNALPEPHALALSPSGAATVVGQIVHSGPFANNFPTTSGAFDTVLSSPSGTGFAFRLSPQGDNLDYSTYIEGVNDGPDATGVAITPTGATVICGTTYSSAFPVTQGSFDNNYHGFGDAFVLRLNSSGSTLEWSTLLGGSGGGDFAHTLKLADDGDVVVAGATGSADFPFTPGAYATAFSSSSGTTWVARLSAHGDLLRWATAIGGIGGSASIPRVWDLALDGLGGVSIVGQTGEATFPTTQGALVPVLPQFYPGELASSYVARLDASGSNLAYSTFVGFGVNMLGLVVDASGIATVIGNDRLGQFPITPGALSITSQSRDVLIARLDPIGSRAYFSTWLPGMNQDVGFDIAMLSAHRAGICGWAQSGFFTTSGAYDSTYNGGVSDGFVAVADLLLQGVRQHGRAAHTCLGECAMNATERPTAGSASFGFYCSGAPPFSNGWLLLGTERALPMIIQGANLLLDPSQRIVRIPVRADYIGFVETRVPLTNLHWGDHFAAQFVWRNPGTCPGNTGLVASHALLIDVQ